MSLPNMQAAEIYDKNGLLLARLANPTNKEITYSHFKSEIPGLLNRQSEQELIVGKNWGGNPEAAIGNVIITVDESSESAKFRKVVLMALLTTALFLSIGIVAAYLFAGSMTRPLSKLTAGAAALKEGDDTVFVPVESPDEIGQLSASFNSMVAAIRERTHELELALKEHHLLNAQLEEKVMKRTAELEGANRELESFNYSASHDLRAPLNRLTGFCAVLKEEYGDKLDDQGLYYIDRIASVGDQMNRVLSAMLTLYQVQQREMSIRTINLSEIVQAVFSTLQNEDHSRDVKLVVSDNITVLGDMKLLWLAVENLLGNSWKFSAGRNGAIIEFGQTENAGEKVCFIKDNGAGFNMAYADKLFTPFQRLHNYEDFPGTGVGLAIVQRIIARHGGRIWLESAEGVGTTCYFVLPGTA
jgi:signal transduction histidine kinase